jgi:hypothetical protein
VIVKLHDGAEGELVGDLTRHEFHPRAGGLMYAPQIIVHSPAGDVELWRGRWTDYQDAKRDLYRGVALAGLCFWPDPDGRDLDLSPWVRDRLDRANEWGGPTLGFCQ